MQILTDAPARRRLITIMEICFHHTQKNVISQDSYRYLNEMARIVINFSISKFFCHFMVMTLKL